MPAKKGGQKNRKKKEEIKQMPSLVFNSIRVTKDTPPTEEQAEPIETTKTPTKNLRENFINEQISRHNKLTYWVWIFVIGMSALIIFFWGYSFWSNISTINWNKTDESQLIKQASGNWGEIFTETKEQKTTKQEVKNEIKELLNKTLAGMTTTSESIITSSTIITNIITTTNR